MAQCSIELQCMLSAYTVPKLGSVNGTCRNGTDDGPSLRVVRTEFLQLLKNVIELQSWL